MSSFLNHLGTSAIMDLLLQMVAAPDSDQCRVDLAWVCIISYMYIHVHTHLHVHTHVHVHVHRITVC